MDPRPKLTDLQYYVYECGVTVDAVAERIGTTPTKVRQELKATPLPDWLILSRQPAGAAP